MSHVTVYVCYPWFLLHLIVLFECRNKQPHSVALPAADVNSKIALCFFTCRSRPFDVGRPLSFSASPSLLLPLCAPQNSHWTPLLSLLFLADSHSQTHTHYYPSLGAVSDSGMKSISEPAPSHHPSPAPIFSHHEVRPLLCQPENKSTPTLPSNLMPPRPRIPQCCALVAPVVII